ncbi:polysaccharide biosynthesis/export family protein [uncultured Azonexus sp.]|uniref:polysaccharide biosynthesis/export family protein n=1 Tax=uncultured Azonexus sp. TaxID=520307 RepID=UPI0026132A7C|nr:polysaccharide biosynthesis/export family protein [uncultured Azonexus sp.]
MPMTLKKLFCIAGLCFAASAIAADDSMSLRPSSALSITASQAGNTGAVIREPAIAQANRNVDPAKVASNQGNPASGAHAVNERSEVFGANLFTGAFAKQSPGRFNPDYAIMIGDQIQVRIWGGFQFDSLVEVDPQGNLFLPHVGPVRVLGVANQNLQAAVEAAVRKVFRANVYSYASLAAPQPVRVFVGGNVNRPGLYNGTSMDSLLSYLDQAGGIDADRGSFLKVEVKRGNLTRATVNLYDFLIEGRIPLVQLAEGDVIFVPPRQSTVNVRGLVANAKRFEFFSGQARTVADLVKLAKPRAETTHVRVVRNTGDVANTEYYPLEKAGEIALQNGDDLEFTADKKPGTITVRVEGEHESAKEYVLPYGTRLGELMSRISYSDRSESDKPQLFRLSVKERQKQMLAMSLKTLESTVLTARSGTASEAGLRAEEAKLILQWVDRAKAIEPVGQVLIAQAAQRNQLLLENGDIIRIPVRDGLVLVGGEVLFPNAVAFDKKLDLDDYIKAAGGYTQNANTSRVVVAHRDGSFEEGKKATLLAGDEILVLPKVDIKSREIAKDIMTMVYQIAIAARVVIGL